MTWVYIGLVLVVFGVTGELHAWHRSTKDARDEYPFNWRVLLGPAVYFKWISRRKK